ncbi:MAG: CinA family protein [Janthinobacterium lividum]
MSVSNLPDLPDLSSRAAFEARLHELAATVGRALHAANLQMVSAESCTGGLVAAAITAHAGSSAWFERGFVTYSNDAKQESIGVPQALVDAHGAVSEAVARAMAEGALAHSHAQRSLSITGVAGPDGGSAEKPVGTVWFGWSGHGETLAERLVFEGDRTQVRLQAAIHALEGLLKLC